MRLIPAKLFLLVLSLQATAVFGQQNIGQGDSIKLINPPYLQFYLKYLDNDGIPIRSSDIVSDTALLVASAKVSLMLKNMPVVRKNLVTNGAEVHVIGKDQQTSDLPEFRAQKGVQYMDHGMMTDIDKRTRGMGGVYASCGEENLLHLPGDRYPGGYDICMHEFAHTIMGFGLDSILRTRIISQYHVSIAAGLWQGIYASTDPDEYWAELTTWYFGAHGEMTPGKQPAPGPASLKAYDPGGYNLIDSIYSGKLQPVVMVKKSRIVAAGIPSGNSTQPAKLVVINNSPRPIKVYWVDTAGNQSLVATVQPAAQYEHATFYTHVWFIDDGKTPFSVQVFDTRCEIKINQ